MKIRVLFIAFFSCLLCCSMASAKTCQLQLAAGGKQAIRCTLSKNEIVKLKQLFSRTNVNSARLILTHSQVSEIKKLLHPEKISNAIVLHITNTEFKNGYWIRPAETFVK